MYIDSKHIQDAQLWLSSKQKENGCFRSSGMLLNNAIKVMHQPSWLWAPAPLTGPFTGVICSSTWEEPSHFNTWGIDWEGKGQQGYTKCGQGYASRLLYFGAAVNKGCRGRFLGSITMWEIRVCRLPPLGMVDGGGCFQELLQP